MAEDTSDGAPLEDVMPADHTGIVTMEHKSDGCEVLIKMTSQSDYTYLIPVALETRYRKEGLELQFNFVASRAPQGECTMGQMAVIQDIGYIK